MSTDEREPIQKFREGIRTPQAFAVPVVGALVAWLTTVASNLLYVVAGALLFVVAVAMSMETVDPRTVERRLYPGAAVSLIVLGGLAVATGPTDGYTAAGALAIAVGAGLLATALGGERVRAGALIVIAAVAAVAGGYFAFSRGVVVSGGVLFVIAAGALARGGIVARNKMGDGDEALHGERADGVATDGRGPD
jgi:uncharacterized membrane protein YfcA